MTLAIGSITVAELSEPAPMIVAIGTHSGSRPLMFTPVLPLRHAALCAKVGSSSSDSGWCAGSLSRPRTYSIAG
jgi:hypothetical protein